MSERGDFDVQAGDGRIGLRCSRGTDKALIHVGRGTTTDQFGLPSTQARDQPRSDLAAFPRWSGSGYPTSSVMSRRCIAGVGGPEQARLRRVRPRWTKWRRARCGPAARRRTIGDPRPALASGLRSRGGPIQWGRRSVPARPVRPDRSLRSHWRGHRRAGSHVGAAREAAHYTTRPVLGADEQIAVRRWRGASFPTIMARRRRRGRAAQDPADRRGDNVVLHRALYTKVCSNSSAESSVLGDDAVGVTIGQTPAVGGGLTIDCPPPRRRCNSEDAAEEASCPTRWTRCRSSR